MHITDAQLQDLAKSYIKEELLNDRQIALKRHMAECDSCYERFCTEYIVIKQLWEQGLVPPEVLEDKASEKIFLTLRSAGKLLELLRDKTEEVADSWSFLSVAQLAFARGSNDGQKQAVYKSRTSSASQIYQTQNEIVIQLDDEAFAVENLAVRYECNGKSEVKRFVYDETTECYVVRIKRKSQDETIQLEIFEIKA